jgi:hypothetical protein
MKMIKVRIAVAINEEGAWCSCGWARADGDERITGLALEGLDSKDPMGERVVFVEAEVPMPEKVDRTIQGEVKP